MAPRSFKSTLLSLAGTGLYLTVPVQSLTNYANVFYNPDYFAAGSFNASTLYAQRTITSWATELNTKGPWTVTSKGMTPPSGSKHDYMSFSPYAWPDCSTAGNTTALTPEQVWTTCEYVTRDGQFNPDVRTASNDIGNFDDMADAVLYNSLAWVINGPNSLYAGNAVRHIQAWFINADTAMNPNLNFAQMRRGPGNQNGTHTGVLDLKCMAKVATAVLVLRTKQASEWTADVDSKMVAWAKEQTNWLQTAPIAIEEAESENNHGSFYFNQLAALQLIAGDKDGAAKTVQAYFNGLFKNQIAGNGDQPLETSRTRPYHYRAYNLAAMITSARIGEYAGFNAWNWTSNAGGTIKTALDHAMSLAPGDDDETELFPQITAVAAQYGDTEGKYSGFLKTKLSTDVVKQPYYFWDNIFIPGMPIPSTSSSPSGPKATTNGNKSGSAGYKSDDSGALSDTIFSKTGFIGLLAVSLIANLL